MHQIQEIICDIIRQRFPLPQVTLSATSVLTDDLGLSSIDIVSLGLHVERYYQERKDPFFLSDEDIINWRTIQDIAASVQAQLK